MCTFARQAVEALEIEQGPSHMEIIYNDMSGPCLVEVGSRCHGGEGTWLPVAQECIGYTQVSVLLDSITTRSLFDSIDKDGYTLMKHGFDVDMVCRHAGIVRAFKGWYIYVLPS